MGNKSGFLARQEQEKNNLVEITERLIEQFMTDTLQIAIHRTEGYGYDRIMRLDEAWREARREFKPAMDPKHPECDVARDHMDRVFAQIVRGRHPIIPSEERYAELKKVSYKARK